MDKFAYFGTPYVARDTLARIVEAGFVPEVVITSPDAPRGRGLTLTPCETKVWAEEHSIPVLTPEALDDVFLEQLSAYECSYAVVVAYGKIVPQTLLDLFPKGVINVHYSLLPKYRGASPVETALRNGDQRTGVTLQKMVYKLDAGDTIAQEEMEIVSDDTTLTLRPRLIELGADLLIRTLPEYLEGAITPVPQDEAAVTRAPKIRKEEGELELGGDQKLLWNTYRALRESPGSYFFAEKDGKRIRVKVTDASFVDDTFVLRKIVPEGKGEQDATWLSAAGWKPVEG